MIIKKIKIENIKGFGLTNNELEINIKPNKYNLLVAPNGFGKSSITAAFSSLKRNRLSVSDDDMHNLDNNAKPKLEIELDNGQRLKADNTYNEISSLFKVYVINNPLTVKATASRKGSFVNAHAELIIPSTIIDTNVPMHIDLGYSYKKMRKKLSKNCGLMPNITDMLANNKFYEAFQTLYTEFDKFEKVGCRKDIIVQNVIGEIENSKGKNLNEILTYFKSENLEKLNNDGYENIIRALSPFLGTYSNNSLQTFLVFYQILLLYRKDKAKVKAKCVRADYELLKAKFNSSLSSLNTTGRRLKAKEHKGNLVLDFPKAKTISNGQRDLLTLFAKLYYFKSILRKGKNYLLLIDEVFDYLDDANFIASQYYLSKIINTKDVNVYVVLLTHLSPRYFLSNIFSGKKLNVQFLDKNISIGGSPLAELIDFRNKMNKDTNPDLYNDISSYLLHYNCQEKDIRSAAAEFDISEDSLPFFSSKVIKQYAYEQLDNYKKNRTYDSIGVALAIRLKIEEILYKKLENIGDKEKFIKNHGTKRKLDFVENCLRIDVPDSFRMLSPIYNDMHRDFDYYRIGNALLNTVVQKLINEVFP